MIGSLLVYGNQQWSSLKNESWGTLSFLYHCVAMVKNRENEASDEAMKKAQSGARSRE